MTPEIEQIIIDVRNMAENLVCHMNNLLPSNLQLDYSEQSLKIIDVLIENLRIECIDEEKAVDKIMALGAYTGEVIKRHTGGHWTQPVLAGFPKDGSTYSVVFLLPNNVGLNPLGRVLKYFRLGSSYSIVAFYEMSKTQAKR